MATRSKTRQFMQSRESAVRRRQRFPSAWNNNDDDHERLVGDEEEGSREFRTTLPPEWVDRVEEVQYTIVRIKQRVKELNQLHDKHLNRPTLDGNSEEEYAIEIMTQEITQMFQSGQKQIKIIGHRTREAQTAQEAKMCKNVMISLAADLQNLSSNFRGLQSTYLKKIRGREQRKRQHFNSDLMTEEASSTIDIPYDQEFTEAQLIQIENDTQKIQDRDSEIASIAKSIRELSEIFKELSTMIIDQGTIVDRIDYNLEQVQHHVSAGREQLEIAHEYQKKSRKWICMLVLIVLIIGMCILLAFK